MDGVQIKPPYVEKASRMEMFYRIGYLIAYYFVAMIFSIVIMFTWPLQVLSILIRGKRSYKLHKINIGFYEYDTEFMVYFYSEKDQRPRFFTNIELEAKKAEGKTEKVKK